MSTARDEILQRIRTANTHAGVNPTPASPRGGGAPSDGTRVQADGSPPAAPMDGAALIELFIERTEDYEAVVESVTAADAPARVADAVRATAGVLVPDGFPRETAVAIDPRLVRTDPGSPAGLDAIEAVVTTCAAAIAETGTIVLDHGDGQGRRALTLVPDLHVCLVRASQVHADVGACVRAVRPSVEAGHVLTWISGPSATSDIELDRVEGVHGPRRLHVIVVTDA